MEKLSETFENIKERFSNPLIFSFIVSWLICNWQITLTLVWHDLEEVKRMGFNDTYQFLRFQLCHNHNYITPIFVAIGYTFAFPFLRNLIRVVNAASELLGDKYTLKINKGASIPFEEYYKLDLKIKEREIKLSEMIQNAGELTGQILTLEQAGRDNDNIILDLKKQIEILEDFKHKLTDNSFLDGYWTLQVKDDLNEHQARGWFVKDGKINLITEEVKVPHYIISSFYYYKDRNEILFIATVMKNNTIIDVFNLRMNNEDHLTGFRNNKQVTLTRGYAPLNLEQ